jgi:hypothetical protein
VTLKRQIFAIGAVVVLATAGGVVAITRAGARSAAARVAASASAASASASASALAGPPVWPPAGPDELAIVAPLAPGDRLGDWVVRSVSAVVDGRMRVTLRKDKRLLRLEILLASEDGPAPPASSGKYAIFYRGRGAEPDEAAKAARSLADVISKHRDVRPPPGMTSFHEATRDPTLDEL